MSEAFKKRVMDAKARTPEFQLRYLAFVEDLQGEAFKGHRGERGARYMAWIDARKRQYEAAHPDKVLGGFIRDHQHFTDYVVSGVWLNSTNC